ncbi:MAG: SDR family oxidoreductase [Rhodocyclaceae bacterium]|nr:SDR family oxidoreductase [Rhodocyclaceae bacterium]
MVTGAGSGIGRATALLFATAGANVVCADISGAEATAEAIRVVGGIASSIVLDVRRQSDWAQLVEQATGEYGGIDVLASVAGVVAPATDTAVDQDEDGWQRIIDVDLKGVWLGMRAVIPGMLTAGGGRIVNVASMAGLIGLPNLAAYSAAKGGVISLSRQTAIQYAAKNVLVNVIAPGIIETPILGDIPDDMRVTLKSATPLGRMGRPEEIASMIVHLAGAGGSFITGQVFAVDGGWTAQ